MLSKGTREKGGSSNENVKTNVWPHKKEQDTKRLYTQGDIGLAPIEEKMTENWLRWFGQWTHKEGHWRYQ